MKGIDLLRLASLNLRENLVRSCLCALAVAVGTGALFLIAAIGMFGKAQVEQSIRTMGVGGLSVSLEQSDTGSVLTKDIANAMERSLAAIDSAMPVKVDTCMVRVGKAEENAVILGADERLDDVMQLSVQYGALINAQQANNARPVAVVGDLLANRLFGRTNIVGRQIRLWFDGCDHVFTVCAVVTSQTDILGGSVAALAPHFIYIPYDCLVDAGGKADQVLVRCMVDTDAEQVGGQIERYLSNRLQAKGAVHVQNISGMVSDVRKMADLCVALFIATGGITLVVALIGVLCSMLAATHEKTEEIGILLALGAQPKSIRRLFLVQSVLLCCFGGLCGIAAVVGCLHLAGTLLLPDWRITVILLLVAVCSGGIAGWLPAWRASRLDPIEAMRN